LVHREGGASSPRRDDAGVGPDRGEKAMATVISPETNLFRVLFSGRYAPLLASLLLLLVAAPFLTEQRSASGVLDLFLCVVMLAGIYAAVPRRRSLAIGVLLAAPTVASHWATEFATGRAMFALHYALVLAMFAYATGTILIAIVGDDQVTPDTIKG